MQYNITGLAPWTVYEVQVAAMTVARGPWTVVRESRTNESGKWVFVWIESSFAHITFTENALEVPI